MIVFHDFAALCRLYTGFEEIVTISEQFRLFRFLLFLAGFRIENQADIAGQPLGKYYTASLDHDFWYFGETIAFRLRPHDDAAHSFSNEYRFHNPL